MCIIFLVYIRVIADIEEFRVSMVWFGCSYGAYLTVYTMEVPAHVREFQKTSVVYVQA